MNKTLVLGIGNPFRGDDGAGLAVIDALRGKNPPHVTLKKERGDIASLIDHFATYNTVYLIDACVGLPSWRRFDLTCETLPTDTPLTSTHGFSIKEAVALAKTLGKLPKRLILYALPATHLNMSDTLSLQVQHPIAAVTHALLQELT